MSGEEDTELRDLVAQTLENNGVLSKIRAELRASVFLALEEHESLQSKHPFQNKRLKDFLHTTEGVVVASLVKEFLEFFNLDYTLSVFEPESYCGSEFCPSSREELSSQLGIQDISEKSNVPLLSLFVQPSLQNHFSGDATLPINKKYMADSVVNGNVSPEERSTSSSDEKCQTPSPHESPTSPRRGASPVTQNETLKINNLTLTIENLDASTEINAASCPRVPENSSLGLLPPLQKTVSLQPPQTQDPIKILMDIASPCDSLDNYEEDFQSSVSGEQAEVHAGAAASGSEDIEEEVASEPASTASAVEELTMDMSVSLPACVFADHLESV